MNKTDGCALLLEVADVLQRHGRLQCAPDVEMEDGTMTIIIRLHPEPGAGAARLDLAELYQELRLVRDIASLRVLAGRYGIDPAKLEALLPEMTR